MKPLNYLRQAKTQFAKENYSRLPETDQIVMKSILATADRAVKFTLPNGGRLFETEFTHIPDELRLPFPSILLEYSMDGFGGGPAERVYGEDSVYCPKRICIATENEDMIQVNAINCIVANGKTSWGISPYTVFITRLKEGERVLRPDYAPNSKTIEGLGMQIVAAQYLRGVGLSEREIIEAGMIDTADETNAVLAFMEIMNCSNVETETLPKPAMNKSAARRGVLPFDSYRILTIKNRHATGDGHGHASVITQRREHLRRGHIRNHPTAGRIWVNSCVVNAGVGGKIYKDYVVHE
jgi:hypothetical protein